MLEDRDIIDLYWLRSESAIEETDKKYRTRCIYIARNILNDISDAEECLNDTYMTAWNRMPDERPKFLGAFLFRIIRNHAMNRLRYLASGKRKNEGVLAFDELDECIADTSDSIEDTTDESELSEILNEFIAGLDYKKRFIFIRRYWYLDSYAQISALCEEKEENISMILSRIRKNLRKYLNERGFY
ncbi:sigma-70 family RNA polymerase sigma factor [Ruminococcus sp. HUN007]|uniref:RNA polymerase sigma factor n=1 Tax=Ruminococcus sp. HUN007 TaxID=1514668 RepID=UPI0006798F04|nr:sigma-70 family RNA polymerase sigma factor [Ruminococcus sp. HUN007]